MLRFLVSIIKLKKFILGKTLLLIISALILGTVFAFGLQIILAQWQGPTQNPPGGGPQYEFLNSGPSPQLKQGSLGSEGDVTSGGSITANYNLTAQGELYIGGTGSIEDIYLRSIDKWASDRNVDWITDCTHKNQGETCPPNYVVTTIDATGFTCCAPNVPGPPPPPYPLVKDYFDVGFTCQATGAVTTYIGQARLRFINGETLEGVPSVKVKGTWSGATDICSNNSPTCLETKTIDSDIPTEKGTVSFASKGVYDVNVYGKQFCFNISPSQITIPTSAQLQPPSPPWQACSTFIPQKDHRYSYVSSIAMDQTFDPQTYNITATVTVTIANENNCPLDGLTVAGYFTKPSTTSYIYSPTENGGKAIFTTTAKYWDPIKQFSFQIYSVTGGPTYESHGNESITQDFAYTGKRPAGETCSCPDGLCDECENPGLCYDGVCCRTDCTGTCQQCNKTGSIGTCVTRVVDDNTKCDTCGRCDGNNTSCQRVLSPDCPPAQPTLLSPANGDIVGGTTIVVHWNPVATTSVYWLEVNTDPAWGEGTRFFYASTDCWGGQVLTGLPNNGTTYYWRVWAGNPSGWSPPSITKSFVNKSDSFIPGTPILFSPSNGEGVEGTSVTFRWTTPAGTTTFYWLEVNKDPNWSINSRVYYDNPGDLTTSKTVNGLLNDGTTHYWRVWAGNGTSWSPASSTGSFINKSLAIPEMPYLLYPANTSSTKAWNCKDPTYHDSHCLSFSWYRPPRATVYWLEVNTDPNWGAGTRLYYAAASNTNYCNGGATVSGFQNYLRYYWRVWAGSGSGWTVPTSGWFFDNANQ